MQSGTENKMVILLVCLEYDQKNFGNVNNQFLIFYTPPLHLQPQSQQSLPGQRRTSDINT